MVNWVKEMLEKSRVHYEQKHHRPATTARRLAEVEGIDPAQTVKVVIVVYRGRPLALVLPATRRVDLEKVQRLVRARVRLASKEEIARYFPDCAEGAIPPLRHGKDVDFWMDNSMDSGNGDIVFPTGTAEDAVQMSFDAWYRLLRPRVEHFTVEWKPLLFVRA